MANEKNINSRIQHKHDIEANWLKASNFIPKIGEIIIYDPDENYPFSRVKIGDGNTNVNNLPLITDGEYLKKTGDWMTGPFGLTLDVGYGLNLPTSGSEGQVFFLEDETSGLPAGGTEGQIIVKNSSADGDASWQNFPELNYLPLTGGNVSGTVTATKFSGPLDGTATNATNIYSSASTSKAYILGTTTASSANHATVYNASVYTSGSVLYGAAWNDYAEYRICNENFIPG